MYPGSLLLHCQFFWVVVCESGSAAVKGGCALEVRLHFCCCHLLSLFPRLGGKLLFTVWKNPYFQNRGIGVFFSLSDADLLHDHKCTNVHARAPVTVKPPAWFLDGIMAPAVVGKKEIDQSPPPSSQKEPLLSLWACHWQGFGYLWCVQWLCCVIKLSTSPQVFV